MFKFRPKVISLNSVCTNKKLSIKLCVGLEPARPTKNKKITPISRLTLLKKNYNKKTEALALINEAKKIYNFEKNWRLDGNKIILSDLIKLSETGTETFGLRKQDKLNKEQAIYLASCKSVHEDISLYF